jgi:hypothetical protein
MAALSRSSNTAARSVAPDVARFEEMCAEKSLLEANIVKAIGEIDSLARENVKLVEDHLERTTVEGASFLARLERARKGEGRCTQHLE